MSARTRLRIEESASEAAALRAEVTDWRRYWVAADVLGSHVSQLDLLTKVTLGLTDAIAAQIESIKDRDVGETYDACRRQDRKLLHTRRLWRWYLDKLDPRNGPDQLLRQTLIAADALIWSCWKTSFTALGESVPAPPIAYLAPEYAASATPRSDFPHGLRPGQDELLKKHLEQLPVPVIGLPPVCRRRPWWLILAVHETSHHLQFEVKGLEQWTQEAIRAAVGQPGPWLAWGREIFADACSVLLAGPAAIWAVRELETRPDAEMSESQSATYPPPLVRLALMNEVATQAGLPAEPSSAQPADPVIPAVAKALLRLMSPRGHALRELAEGTDPSVIARHRAALSGPGNPVPHPSLDASRLCAAAGVEAWQQLAATDGEAEDLQPRQETLAERLRTTIALSREPGTHAGEVVTPDADAITRRFLADLDKEESRA